MKYISKMMFALVISLGVISCNIDTVDNPNGPTQESFAQDATLSQLQLLTTGLEASLRNDMEFYYQTVSIVGREYYDLNGTDPRYTGELLGAGAENNVLDDNGFLTTRAFAARYRSARNAQLLLDAVANSNAGLDAAGTAGFNSFAKTCMAYNLLLTLNRQFDNGVRLDIADPDNLGPFVSYDEGLAGISEMLNSALDDANAAGDEFEFSLSGGFSGYDTPNTFGQFISGLIARVEMYRGNKDAVRSALSNSFMDMSGDLGAGPAHVFSGAGNDRLNPLFYPFEQARYMAHPSFRTDADDNDSRLAKITTIEEVVLDGLSSSDQVQVYSSNIDPVSIIKNEELILLMAEANIGNDNAAAVSAINTIRNAYGVGDYTGGTSDSELVDEVLKQRRYSLFGEGHRWIDMRRYNKLGDLPLDRPGDQVFVQFPRPVLEPS